MKNADITDPVFLEAVEAIDAGELATLKKLITQHPRLLQEKLVIAGEGYFDDPYLLFFVADNPIRVDKLPPNIVEITGFLVKELKDSAADSWQYQLDYTLGLVATGSIPRECNVQTAMIDLLMDAGAKPSCDLGPLAQGNISATEHLLERGCTLTLGIAIGLDRLEDVKRLAASAKPDETLVALAVAAFYGKASMVSFLLDMGAASNGYPAKESGFHTHATPLHQAVQSGSPDCVKLLVEAGARLDARDKMYDGTPFDWAQYMQREEGYDEEAKENFAAIEAYLISVPLS